MLLNDSTRRLKILSDKLGSCIEKSRPYYELLEDAKKAQQDCQEITALYKKANGSKQLIELSVINYFL